MTLRKKDFQKVVVEVKDFISKLTGFDTAELRDALNFTLLHLHKYYKKLRHKSKTYPQLDGSVSLTSSLGSFSPASPFIPPVDKFDWRWINLDASKLSVSFGQGDKTNLLPEIFYVIKDADIDRLKELIETDSDCINEVDALGRTTALYCIHGKTDEHIKCLKILIAHGVDLNQEANDGLTCVHMAAITSDEEVMDTLIKENVNINVEDSEGRYPLHFGAGFSSSTCVKKLLDAGADKNCLDNDEMTPAMWACYFDQHENVELLLNIFEQDDMKYEAIDAELQDKDLNGQTVLHWSVSRSQNINCFKLLFSDNYASIKDDVGRTVLHTIAEKGNLVALEEYLSTCDAPTFEILDNKDRTPLHLACMCGHGEMVDVLLNRGAPFSMIDKHGHTPFDYAKARNLNYCMLVLLSHQKYRTQNGVHEKQHTPPLENSVQTQPKKSKPPSKNSEKVPPIKLLKMKSPDPVPNRRPSIQSQFDTPQDNVSDFIIPQDEEALVDIDHGENVTKKESFYDKNSLGNQANNNFNSMSNVEENEREEGKSKGNFQSDEELSFNDQMIVLVEHHGSDDEVLIDVDSGNDDIVFSDKDEDLLDVPPFARNGSITTVGVVSEGSMAFNSVSVNPSVSSLVSSDDSDDERGKKNMRKRSPITDSMDLKVPDSDHVTKKNSFSGKSANLKRMDKQKSLNAVTPPRSAKSPSFNSYSSHNVTAPIPPPSQYYPSQHSSLTGNEFKPFQGWVERWQAKTLG